MSSTATLGPETVEVLDEATRVVMVFPNAAAAELYGLTGQPTWLHTRLPGPADHVDLSLAAMAGLR